MSSRGSLSRATRRLLGNRPGGPGPQKMAFCSPVPPAPTGVATYARAVLAGLRRAGYLDGHPMDLIWPVKPRHEELMPWYALGIYQIGNNVAFHRDIYRLADQAPGLTVLHDLALDDFVRGMKASGEALGYAADREAHRLDARVTSPDARLHEPLRTPWAAHIARRSRGLIVHSGFCRRYLQDLGCRTPIFVVPHPVVERWRDVERAATRRNELRAPLAARGAKVVVGAFGDLNAAKLLDVVMAAVGRLDPSVHLVVVGRRIGGYDIDGVAEESGLGSRLTLRPDVGDDEFRAWLGAADIAVDLRFPHRGEVSGSLARTMQAGVPTVVSGTGTYLDVPEGLVARVASGRPSVEELAAAFRRLAEDRELRDRMGRAAREHVLQLSRSDATTRGYVEAIEHTRALVRDPARQALARWADALADLGLTTDGMDEGYGLSYAQALQGLQPEAAEAGSERG